MGTVAVKWHYHQYNDVQSHYSDAVIVGDSNGDLSLNNYATNTDFNYDGINVTYVNATNMSFPCIISCSGGISGGAYIPNPPPVQDSVVNGGFITTYERPYVVSVKTNFPNGCDGISDNGEYYIDNSGDYREISDDSLVADSSDVQNLPSGVTFNGWLLDDFIMIGSDGKYYDVSGNEVMQNLPDGVTLESQIGNIYLGSDNKYYDVSGNEVMQNLPNGVTIVSYDSEHDVYVGSDGNNYDVNGNPTSICDGDLLLYHNMIRLEIVGVDIFGHDVSVGGDVIIGQSEICFPTGSLIREIKGIIARNLYDDRSVGFGNLTIKADVVGAKIGLDLEGVDVDGVLGEYTVANCIFQACNKYADYVLNDDLPLGIANQTSLDIGYYCCTSCFQLYWEGFDSSDFPYCCGNYDDTENESDGIGKTDDKLDVDVDCLCEHLESIDNSFIDLNLKVASLTDAVDSLLCVCSKIDDLIIAINNKDFSITVQPSNPSVTVTNPVNNVTVEPCSPIVTNPVNNITVQPSNPSVTVTNPVNNVTVEPCSPVVNPTDLSGLVSALQASLSALNSSLASNTDALVCSDSSGNAIGVACILKNALNSGDDSLTDVLKNKDMSPLTDVTVSPWDYVNIRNTFRDDDIREG